MGPVLAGGVCTVLAEHTGIMRRLVTSATPQRSLTDVIQDGTWSFKYEAKGMDVVISIIWIAL